MVQYFDPSKHSNLALVFTLLQRPLQLIFNQNIKSKVVINFSLTKAKNQLRLNLGRGLINLPSIF